MTIQEIKRAIAELSSSELAHFRQWFEEFNIQAKGEQFERDAKSGKPDKLEDIALIKKRIRKLRGSLKGSGAMKALIEERHKG